MGRFDAGDRHSDDLIAAIDHAAHSLNHTLREGFLLLALQIKAASNPATDNSAAIEAQAQKLKDLTAQLRKSNP